MSTRMQQVAESVTGRGRRSRRPSTSASSNGGLVSRLRSRSASVRRGPGSVSAAVAAQQADEPEHPEASDKPPSAQVADILERHQIALKMEVTDAMENLEKEIQYWKTKALKLKLKERTNEQKSVNGSGHTPGPEAGPADARAAERISSLEKEVQSRSMVIETLRSSLLMHEQAREESVHLLESQLERLVELNTKVASREGERMLSERHANGNGKTGGNQDPSQEASVLEQLLARVLAEKDKLMAENHNLKAILRSRPAHDSDGPSPSNSRRSTGEGNQLWNSHATFESGAKTEELQSIAVRYQLSCKHCTKNHSHVKYAGACAGDPANSQKLLKKRLNEHFASVWRVIQEEEGSISSSVHPEEWQRDETNPNSFPLSSLARHIAKHCHKSANEADVKKWCRENVKIEIKPGSEGSQRGSVAESKGKKKSKQKMLKKRRGSRESSF
ncbi:hypothetical protein ACHAXT_001266 [Thalassiosira profunda]